MTENSHGHGFRHAALHLNGDLNVLDHVGRMFCFPFLRLSFDFGLAIGFCIEISLLHIVLISKLFYSLF